jgi:HEAT repeat protein
MLSDAETDVRIGVLEILSGAPEPSTIPALREALRDPEPRVRRMAARALGAHGTDAEPALPDLIGLANGDEEDDVREHAVRALGGIGLRTPQVVTCLRERSVDPDPSVRRASITATVRLEEHEPSDVLSLLDLADDPDIRVRETVHWALRRYLADTDPAIQAAAREVQDHLRL